MRKYLLAASAAVAIATPAAAKDNSGYVGIEGGVMFPQHQTLFGNVDFTDPYFSPFARTDIGSISYKKPGWDIDAVGGYDFGMFRLEGEIGYKRAKIKSLSVNSAFVNALNAGSGNAFTTTTNFGIDDKTSVFSAMLNGLLDLGGQTGIGGYVGGGVGYADVHQFNGSKGKFAWQLLAGVYYPVSDNIDIGLNYRYFRAGTVSGTHDFVFAPGTGTCAGGLNPCSGGTVLFDTDSRFSSHSLLLSLVYNFAAAAPPPPPQPPPPPPPPAAPATQTCPDGSVIAATSTCPAPPPPPPPPPAPTERGERGR